VGSSGRRHGFRRQRHHVHRASPGGCNTGRRRLQWQQPCTRAQQQGGGPPGSTHGRRAAGRPARAEASQPAMHARMHGHGHGTARIEACSQQPTAASSSQPADPVDPDQGTRTRTIVGRVSDPASRFHSGTGGGCTLKKRCCIFHRVSEVIMQIKAPGRRTFFLGEEATTSLLGLALPRDHPGRSRGCHRGSASGWRAGAPRAVCSGAGRCLRRGGEAPPRHSHGGGARHRACIATQP
jgi:hypothetical protein